MSRLENVLQIRHYLNNKIFRAVKMIKKSGMDEADQEFFKK